MSQTLLDDLKAAFARGEVVVIAGTGVSAAATAGDRLTSWRGLLHHGVSRCEEVASNLPAGWGDRVRGEIDSPDLDDLLSAAEKIGKKLGAPTGGEFARWLADTVGVLTVTNDRLLQAIAGLGCPIVTTNYDSLLQQTTGYEAAAARDGAHAARILRGEESGIVHLHGYWKRPETVVLGIRSYQDILGDTHTQALQQALGAMKTLLFVGCGAGLDDPNLSALLAWTAGVFGGDPYRHFRLCTHSEEPDLRKRHDGERIFPLAYGASHDDLAPFLERLRRPTIPTPNPTPAPAADRLPVAPRCFGRDDLVQDLVRLFDTETPPPVCILGGPGIGKSNLTLTALHHGHLRRRYADRRYFVRCDGAMNRDLLAAEIARNLGLPPGPRAEERVMAHLEQAPTLLALDNAETPWEADRPGTEAFLAGLAGIAGLGLVAGIRGNQKPAGLPWQTPAALLPLPLAEGRKVFLAIAGSGFANDPDLDELVREQDGLPIALELLAYQAEGEPDLRDLRRRWEQHRADLLRRDGGAGRLDNLAVSLELSLSGPRMTAPARRLFGLLGLLPDGAAREDLESLLPEHALEAASILRKTGLAFDDQDHLRLLAPVRRHAEKHHIPEDHDRDRVLHFYGEKARTLGWRLGFEGGAEASRVLTAELGNLFVSIPHLQAGDDPGPGIEAARGLGKYQYFVGFADTTLLNTARDRARRDGRLADEANCIRSIGDIALARSDYDTAYECYEVARPIFKMVGDILGEANCILRLGDIAFAQSDHDTAQYRYEEAWPLFHNVIHNVGSLLGEANCIKGLGDIAFALFDHDSARLRYEEALPLFQKVRDVLGEANCIQRLGDIALALSDNIPARLHYEVARPLFQKAGSLLGEANCTHGIGAIALREGDKWAAKLEFESALVLYIQIHRPYSIGWVHRLLARIDTGTDRARHVEAARQAWLSIKRDDLVKDLNAEFPRESIE